MTDENRFLIYSDGKQGVRVEARIEDENIWLTQRQIVDLFQTAKSTVSEHIKNIYAEGELLPESTVRKIRTVQQEGEREVARELDYYNLDMIISLGYRINSKIATQFRIWATAILKEYLKKGFVLNDDRLKGTGGGNYWKELLERIRDIRSSEKVLYRQVLDLYATSIDYDPKSSESIVFFKTVQNKLHYAVNKQTVAETIYSRADAEKNFMGLTSFSGKIPIKSDAKIAKNYLDSDEFFRLNRMVSAFFDLAEIRAKEHTSMSMKNWVEELDRFTKIYGKGTLENAGSISHEEGMKKADEEYRKYQVKTLSPVEKEYLDTIMALEQKIIKKGSKA